MAESLLKTNYIMRFKHYLGRPDYISMHSHYHRFIEYYYVANGFIEINIDGNKFFGGKGDVIIVNPFQLHRTKEEADSEYYFGAIDTELIKCFHKTNIQLQNHLTHTRLEESGISGEIRNCIDCIEKYIPPISGVYRFGGTIFEQSIVHSETLKLYNLFAMHFPVTDTNAPLVKNNYSDFNKFENYINENYMNPVTLKDIAELLNYSESYTSRFIKNISGGNFKNTLVRLRIRKSIDYLISTNDPIEEIALRCGFNSTRSFYKQFTSITGETPHKFRIQSRGS